MLQSYSSKVRSGWRESWKNKNFRWQFILSCLTIIGLGLFFPGFFDYLQARNGKVLNDIIVDNIPPHDVSWMVFFLLYCGVIICLTFNFLHPKNLLIAFEVYALVTLMRIVTLSLVPLNPPIGYVELKEPVLSLLFTNNGRICSHDLFFSGHVTSALAMYYSVKQRLYKNILLIFSCMIGVLVLVQHVHYTIDVIVAPFGTYLCYWFSKKYLVKNLT